MQVRQRLMVGKSDKNVHELASSVLQTMSKNYFEI